MVKISPPIIVCDEKSRSIKFETVSKLAIDANNVDSDADDKYADDDSGVDAGPVLVGSAAGL